MRRIHLIFLLLLCMGASAQDKYDLVLKQIQSLSRYEAIYHLIKYQKANPHFHAVYYQLGETQSSLIKEYHPIRNYAELHDCLYRAQLYYGNCLYYAKDETLRASYYPTIPSDSRTIEYEQLYGIALSKRTQIQQMQAEADTLYDRYHRMVDNYSDCRELLTRFFQDYPSEKNAHLTLSDSSEAVLRQLISTFEHFQSELKAYQQVQDEPIIVTYQPVVLYRLDGLTSVSFLQDTVNVWNYKAWAEHFLQEQNTYYSSYYSDIANAFTQPNPVLINRINRTDYQSFMIPLIRLFGNEALYQPCTSLDSLYAQYTYLEGAKKDVQLVADRVSEDDIRKYRDILSARSLMTPDSIRMAANEQEQVLQQRYADICTQFASTFEKTDSVLHYDEVLDLSIVRRQLPAEWQEDAIIVVPYVRSLVAVVLPKRVEFVPLSQLLDD